MMFFDWTYVVIVLPLALISLLAQLWVKSAYARYAKVYSQRNLTADDAVKAILKAEGLYDVRVGRIKGNLTDNYNPKDNTIYLSDSVSGSTSVAAIGVAAHEAGHAIQHATGYLPIKIRSAIVPITQFGSKLSTPLILLGLLLGIYKLAYFGVLLFGTVVIFQLVTLPTEFNASRRAVKILSEGNYLSDDEVPGVRRVLSAAASTYLAALFVSLGSLLRLLIIVSGGRNRRD